MRRRSSSAALTIRARDSFTVSSCARTSACSRAFTSARRAAAATASTSFGSSRSDRVVDEDGERLPVVLDQRHRTSPGRRPARDSSAPAAST